MVDLKEFKNELLKVYKNKQYCIDNLQDLKKYSIKQADLYNNKIDRLELLSTLAKKYDLNDKNIYYFSNKLEYRIDTYNSFYLEKFIFDYLKNYLKINS